MSTYGMNLIFMVFIVHNLWQHSVRLATNRASSTQTAQKVWPKHRADSLGLNFKFDLKLGLTLAQPMAYRSKSGHALVSRSVFSRLGPSTNLLRPGLNLGHAHHSLLTRCNIEYCNMVCIAF